MAALEQRLADWTGTLIDVPRSIVFRDDHNLPWPLDNTSAERDPTRTDTYVELQGLYLGNVVAKDILTGQDNLLFFVGFKSYSAGFYKTNFPLYLEGQEPYYYVTFRAGTGIDSKVTLNDHKTNSIVDGAVTQVAPYFVRELKSEIFDNWTANNEEHVLLVIPLDHIFQGFKLAPPDIKAALLESMQAAVDTRDYTWDQSQSPVHKAPASVDLDPNVLAANGFNPTKIPLVESMQKIPDALLPKVTFAPSP